MEGLKGALAAAQVLVLTALDLVTDDELRAASKADFERRTEGFEYVSPIPAGKTGIQDSPLGSVAKRAAPDTSAAAIWRTPAQPGRVAGVEERELYEGDRELLFVVLFDLRALLARLVALVAGGDDDEEEEPEADDPDS